MTHLSASFSATLRVRLSDAPGAFARWRRRSATRAGRWARSTSCASTGDEKVRDVTVAGAERRAHRRRSSRPCAALDGVEVEHVSDRTFLLHLGGKIEMRAEVAAEDARRPLDGVHAWGRARLPRDRRRPRRGLEPHDQAELRSRSSRDGTAVLGLGRHRPGGRDAGDGGQGDAVQGVRGRRRVARSASRRRTWTRSSRSARRSPRRSAASTSRTSRRRAASRSRSACAASSTSPSSTTTSTGRRSSSSRRSSTRYEVVGKRLEDVKIVLTGVGAAGIATADILLHAGAVNVIGVDRAGAVHRGRTDLALAKAAFAERTNPARRAAAPPTTRSPAQTSSSASPPRARSASPASGAWPPDAIVFAMANPTPEVSPEEIADLVAVVGDRQARTTRTRSTTSSPSRGSSAARSTSARARSRRG